MTVSQLSIYYVQILLFKGTCVIILLFIQLLNQLKLLWDMEEEGSFHLKPSENEYHNHKDVGVSFLDYSVFF